MADKEFFYKRQYLNLNLLRMQTGYYTIAVEDERILIASKLQ
jgi:hypothetical protein